MTGKVALHTLGCKLNFSETSTIGEQFLSDGFEVVDFNDKADVYVFNTCTVTENAERECRQLVRKVLRKNSNAFVIVTGCYAQLRPEEILEIDGVDLVLGSNEKFKVFDYVNDFSKDQPSCVFVSPTESLTDFGTAHSTEADSRTRAFLKIQDGCDYKCTFCTIPLARGKSRSMQLNDVVKEFKGLINSGYKEVILTGVNVGDYGKGTSSDLYELLKELINVDGDFRIRISSIEPNLLTDRIIDLTSNNDKLCNHFHIPLQSGSSSILKSMKRRYRKEDYLSVIQKVKIKIPDAGIGIDVITGFPGETDSDFLETYKFINELPASYLHVFTYSERPNTEAILLDAQVDKQERKRRTNMLRILSEKKKNAFLKEMNNENEMVLFESFSSDGQIKGFTSNYIRVQHKYDPSLENNLAEVLLTGFENGIANCNLTEQKFSVDLESATA